MGLRTWNSPAFTLVSLSRKPFASGDLALAKPAGEFLCAGRDAGVAVDHGLISVLIRHYCSAKVPTIGPLNMGNVQSYDITLFTLPPG
jgi:hypothetical protein